MICISAGLLEGQQKMGLRFPKDDAQLSKQALRFPPRNHIQQTYLHVKNIKTPTNHPGGSPPFTPTLHPP